ncbi:MAG: hypothetical protein ABR985_21555 [Methanotrichaceae archaeon]
MVGPVDERSAQPGWKARSIFPAADKTGHGLPARAPTSPQCCLQIDPIVPSDVLFNLKAPDGSKRTAQGKGDRFGYFTSKEKWPLDQPGVWTYTVNATWNGFKGRVPGLPVLGWLYLRSGER